MGRSASRHAVSMINGGALGKHTDVCPVSELCHREAVVNGLCFHYVKAGTGPVVLLPHGFTFRMGYWRSKAGGEGVSQ
jgi:hypothetical protein